MFSMNWRMLPIQVGGCKGVLDTPEGILVDRDVLSG